MEIRVEDDLIDRYPEIFQQSKQNPLGIPYRGIQCDVGWFPLIDRLCSKIQGRVNNQKSKQVTIMQIKEKDGSLRISYYDGDDYIQGLIDMTQELSNCTCEVCGRPGSKKKLLLGWIKTICETCETKLNERI